MSNFDPGIVPAEGQDYNAQQEIYDPLVSINDQLSRLNLNFEAKTPQLEVDTPEGSFESALKGVLSSNYTKHQLADAIESLFYSQYDPILDSFFTSTVIVTFDGNDKLDTVYKRSSINQETACNGFGYHTKTNSLFKLVLKLQSLDNDQNVASKTTDLSIYNYMRITLQGLTSPNQLQAPSSSNQQQDPLKDVFTSLYQIHPNHVTSIDLVDVVTLAELTTEINDQDNNQNWSSILSGPPIDPDTAIKSHIDYFVRKYFRSNSKPISNESLERLEFELKKPRSNDVIEFIRVHKGRDLGNIRTLYQEHLENRKEYCRIINEICTIISTKDMWDQIISHFPCTIKDLVNNKISPFTAGMIASQTASFCDSLCDNHKLLTPDEIMEHMKFVNDSIQKLENTNSNRSQIQPLIDSMKFSSSKASEKLVGLGFKGIGATPELPEDVQSSVEQSLQMIQDWAELLPLSITEAYRDFRACRGLSKIIINQVQDQKNAEIRPPASATEVPHIWNCYPSSPHSDLLHIVPWRKGPENTYYRPSDAPTHCVVAAIGWSKWTGFDQRVKDATDGILGTEEFNSFQRDIWRAVANFLPSLFDVCEELLANGTTYDNENILFAGYSHAPTRTGVKEYYDQLLKTPTLKHLSQYFQKLFGSFRRIEMPKLPSGYQDTDQCHMVSYHALISHIYAKKTLRKLVVNRCATNKPNPAPGDIIPWFNLNSKRPTSKSQTTQDHFDSLVDTLPLFGAKGKVHQDFEKKLDAFAKNFCKFANFLVKDPNNLRPGPSSVNSSIGNNFDLCLDLSHTPQKAYTAEQMSSIFRDFILPSVKSPPNLSKLSVHVVKRRETIYMARLNEELKSCRATVAPVVPQKGAEGQSFIWVASSDISPFFYYHDKAARSCLPIILKTDDQKSTFSLNEDLIEDIYGVAKFKKFCKHFTDKKKWPVYQKPQ